MAGIFSARKTKKFLASKRSDRGGAFHAVTKQRARETKAKRKARRASSANPTVYDAAGKKFGKFARKSAKLVARVIGGTVGKPPKSSNPGKIVFPSKAAANRYAREHGIKKFKLEKIKRAR